MLPVCMFHESFQVFGVHIYLRDKESLLCTRVGNPDNGEQLADDNLDQRTVISVNTMDETEDDDSVKVKLEKANVVYNDSVSIASTHYFSSLLVTSIAVFACWNRRWR